MPEVLINANEEGGRCWDNASALPHYWHRMTEAEAEYCLGVLPPIYFSGGFAVSEPIRHSDQGEPVYLAVVRVADVPYCRELTIRQAPHAARELRDRVAA